MASTIVGKVLLGQYRVDQFIASGGMGSVYRVWDLQRHVTLAMKVLHAELAEDPAMFDRFKREARRLQKLPHPNIVPFYGIGESDEYLFMLEQFIDGPNMQDILKDRKRQPLTQQEMLVFLKAISSALGFAHHNNIIHCDVKSANVMVDHGGRIYLGDFGIARHANSSTTTMAGAGSAAYMAPEQILSQAVTPATDTYALGIVLFEMVTGQRPFRGSEKGTASGGNTVNERIRFAQLNMATPSPRSLNPNINPQLENVIMRALEKDPSRRYQSCLELLNAVSQAVGVDPAQIPDRLDLATVPFHQSPIPLPPIHEVHEEVGTSLPIPQKHLKPIVFMVGTVIVLLVILVAIASGNNGVGSQPGITPKPYINTQSPLYQTTYPNYSTLIPNQATLPDQATAYSPSLAIPTITSKPTDKPISTMKMVFVHAGDFLMGNDFADDPDERPMKTVNLPDYWIDQTEVTNSMYAQCVDAGKCDLPLDIKFFEIKTGYFDNPIYAEYPVVAVRWSDANDYCSFVNKHLPTEKEWEKAARGEDGYLYPWGDDPVSCTLAFSLECTYSKPISIFKVGSLPAGQSPYGALDMVGNAWEWVADYHSTNYNSGPDGTGERVLRGGGAYTSNATAQDFTATARSKKSPENPPWPNYYWIGFRCASSTAPK